MAKTTTKPDDAMTRLSSFAQTLAETKAKIADLNEKLKAATTLETSIECEDIPTLMSELRMKEFTLLDGTKIEVNQDIKCGITEENKPAAHKWLRDNKFGGIIKTVLMQLYGAGDIEEATKNAAAIEELTGRETHVDETIHYQTLKAFLKEQRAKPGKKVPKPPEKLFGIFPFSRAKVTPPKKG